MKKTLPCLIFIVMRFLSSSAQISITTADLPAVGTTFSIVSSTDGSEGNDGIMLFAIPASGKNLTWDYSIFHPKDTFEYVFKKASSTRFPTATLQVDYKINDTLTFNNYFKPGKNGIYEVGTYSTGGFDSTNYVIPELIFVAPISMGQVVKDSSRYSDTYKYQSIKITSHHFKRQVYSAVGYGSIVTPAGKFDNTLLIKEVEYSFDTNGTLGTPQYFVSSDTSVSYLWVQKDKNLPVVFELDVDINNSDTTSSSASYFSKARLLAVSGAETSNFLGQYPIPADQELNIELKSAETGTLTLYGMDGQAILIQKLGYASRISLETATLPAGMYMYEIRFDAGTSIKNKVVVTH